MVPWPVYGFQSVDVCAWCAASVVHSECHVNSRWLSPSPSAFSLSEGRVPSNGRFISAHCHPVGVAAGVHSLEKLLFLILIS